ncbi:hypothetical protein D3C75_621530 [compost metagenome]
MKASELKYHVEQTDSNYFDRKSMKFFGDTMANYGVRSDTIQSHYNEAGDWVEGGVMVEVWELYRKRPVKHGLKDSVYFSKATYEKVFKAN